MNRVLLNALLPGALLTLLTACGEDRAPALQGYVEGETLRIAAPVSGTLVALRVTRGETVTQGAPLFELEADREHQAVVEGQANARAAQAQIADLAKGKRPSELATLEAQRGQAMAAAELSGRQLIRQRDLRQRKLNSPEDVDRALALDTQNRERVRELTAELETARLAARIDTRTQAEADYEAAQARLAQARWQLEQKQQTAPEAGLIQDTLFRPGEYVPAGQPVVDVLPPDRIKLRFFVPETALARLKPGQTVSVSCDSCGPAFPATIRFISPEAEFTPPVIYSQENREKFVYLVEAWPKPEKAATLRLGQPVDVRLESQP